MKPGSNISSECFGKLCRFHLKAGVTYYGFVRSFKNNQFEIEENNEGKTRKIFALNLIDDYEIYSNIFSPTKVKASILQDLDITHLTIKTKKLVILGAGASYDFRGELNKVGTPITEKLFTEEKILSNYHGAKALRPKILTFLRTGGTLEQFFENNWKEVIETGNLELLSRIINVQYFIAEYFKEYSRSLSNDYPNNYCELIHHMDVYTKEVKNENIALVTFNYDTLLEDSIYHMLDWKYWTINDYIFETATNGNGVKPLKRIMLFKPHGSWNWIHKLERSLFNSTSVGIREYAADIYNRKVDFATLLGGIFPKYIGSDMPLNEIPAYVSKSFQIINYETKLNFDFYPNLLIPYKEKDEILMPVAHQHILHGRMQGIEEILIIGWKGTEDTFNREYFRELVDKENLKITYVSPNSTTLEQELKKYLPKAKFVRVQKTFSEYLDLIKTDKEPEKNFFKK